MLRECKNGGDCRQRTDSPAVIADYDVNARVKIDRLPHQLLAIGFDDIKSSHIYSKAIRVIENDCKYYSNVIFIIRAALMIKIRIAI